MTPPRDIQARLRKYRNEDIHTEHVARLALGLYDLLRDSLRLPVRDRGLIEDAAWLHDIGYASNPSDHVGAGLNILLNDPPSGWSPTRVREVAALVCLHSGSLDKRLRDPLVTEARRPRRLLQLAAFVRFADGLDHGHIQNVRLRGLIVQNPGYALKLSIKGPDFFLFKAGEKLDLWKRVFPATPLSLLPGRSRGPHATLYKGVLKKKTPLLEGARLILYTQYRLMTSHLAGAIEGGDPEHLHILRTALRRFRAGLRFFREDLADTSARLVSLRLAEQGRRLGPLRDADVFFALLTTKQTAARLDGMPDAEAFEAWMRKRRKDTTQSLRRLLKSREWKTALRGAAFLLRIEIPDLQRTGATARLHPRARKALRRLFKRITRYDDLLNESDSEQLHDLRRLCRRERYYAEFFAPLFGKPLEELAARLKALTDALGNVHDLDMALATHAPGLPDSIHEHWRRKRDQQFSAARRAWKRLHQRTFRKTVAAVLDE